MKKIGLEEQLTLDQSIWRNKIFVETGNKVFIYATNLVFQR